MTELLTQVQIEERMYHGGIKRAEAMMAKAEEAGQAHRNPYAKTLFQEFVLPVAEAIRHDLDAKRPGARQAHVVLLGALDADAVAYLAVRSAIGTLMRGPKDNHNAGPMAGVHQHRSLGYELGRSVHCELVLDQIAEINPELYHTLERDLGRRMSKNERHRMTVFKMQAKQAGIEVIEWPIGSRDQVGLYLLSLLEQVGLVEIGEEPPRLPGYRHSQRPVWLTPEVLSKVDQIKDYVAVTMPVYGPCVEPPKDWVTPGDGGFHTNALRRTHPRLVRASASSRWLYREHPMPTVLAAANALQRTAWAVNTRLLDTVMEVAKHFSTKEIVSVYDTPKPADLPWLAHEKRPKEEWEEPKTAEFTAWKRAVAEWHTQRKLMGTRYGRFYSATRAATMFRDYPAVYFVYFADSRGRFYPMTYGINPQGSDLQKALLHFAEGKPVDTPDALRWFHVQGANKWGFDKATLSERFMWVHERRDLLLSFAADPINNTGWKEADKPLQFLAWCLEYADFCNDPSSFVSHLPISMDGSCNGLQNLSAMLRDEIGGRATNLTANEEMQDIYKLVATAAASRMACASPTTMTAKWLAHGIERSACKRSVMTTPYGVTRQSAVKYVISDYLAEGKAPVFDKSEWRDASTSLMTYVWPAIGDVVVKGRECMDWLKKSARIIIKGLDPEAEPVIWWLSPSGFPASQAYFEEHVHRIRTRLAGESAIRVWSESDEADLNRHASGLAPNFVHSMDAAHLHLTTAAAARRGIDALAMIHDDYGTHAANSQALYECIREEFVRMYEEHDPVEEFKLQYPAIPKPPTKGNLDIREVLRSPFFFS